MNRILLAAAPAIILSVGFVVGSAIRMLARAQKFPWCWSCGAAKVRPSQPHGIIDGLAAALLLAPFRCGGCLVRFYGPRLMVRSLNRNS